MDQPRIDERAIAARVEAADVDELARLLAWPTSEEETALRVYLGESRYRRMHYLALRQFARGVRKRSGNVVVIPGIMGSELTAVDRRGSRAQIWIRALPILAGQLAQLQLAADGRSESDSNVDVRPTGILKRPYGELLLALNQNWNVRAFWFDWRKDLNLAADELRAQLSGWFADDEPVHIVAHSMGGLVARTFVKNHSDRWKTMWDRASDGRQGGRLVMLGTPNHGSFAIPQTITGVEGTVRKLALADLRHDMSDLLRILNSFVGTYQMLPSPILLPVVGPLYQATTYSPELGVPQRHLDHALSHHRALHTVTETADPDRMIYVAGTNQPTLESIRDPARLNSPDGYGLTLDGDGRVPRALGELMGSDGTKVPMYFVEETHGNLAASPSVLSSLDALLAEGTSLQLPQQRPETRQATTDEESLRQRMVEDQQAEEDRIIQLARRTEARRVWVQVSPVGSPQHPTHSSTSSADGRTAPSDRDRIQRLVPLFVSVDEREIEELLTREVLGHESPSTLDGHVPAPAKAPEIEVRLEFGRIENAHLIGGEDAPVDAVAVGHYLGVRPQAAELALDRALSAAIRVSDPTDALPL